MHKKSYLFAIGLFSCALSAQEIPTKENVANCWGEAGIRYQVDPWLLYTIAEQESSFNPLAIHCNSDSAKTCDIGLMQINSSWLPTLEKYGITTQSLYDPCTSINVGAWILAQNIQVFGNSWRAVGAYNAGVGKSEKSERAREKYATQVYNRYQRIVANTPVLLSSKD